MAEMDEGLGEMDEALGVPAAGERGRRGATAGGFAAGLVIGVLLGAGIALLYAPDRGDRTRQELRRRLRKLRKEAGEELERAGGGARRELRRRRRQIEERLDRARERFE